ncbi:MAG: hypothetical protein RIQ79_19 [Verrucomicrobiota bacterium]|jgi:peptidyl-prolyl cis-trans isomerase D
MISWIQRTFQQHFKWLFLLLLGTVIVSFVFITNTSGGLHQAGQKLPDRPFFDLNLTVASDQQRLMGDAELSIMLQRGSVEGINTAQIEEYAKQRYAGIHFANKLGLPDPTEADIANHVRNLGAFMGTDGKFDAKRYSDYRDSLKTNPRITEADISRVMLGDVRFAAYRKLLAGPGYVLPAEIVGELGRNTTRWSLAVATIDAAAFSPSIDTSDTKLAAWFTANARRFEIPARVAVAAIQFPSKPDESLKFTDAELRAVYDANTSRFAAEGQTAGTDAAFAAVRAKVETALRLDRANRAALAAASDVAVKLVEQNIKSADLAAFLIKEKLTLSEVGQIGRDTAPVVLGGQGAVSRLAPIAQRLSADAPYSDPVPTPSGAALLVWRDNIAAHSPSLEEVRAPVLSAYRAAEQHRLFNEAGQTLRAAVQAALTAGKPFADAVTAAATAAGLKADIKTIAPFTTAEPPKDLDYSVFGALDKLAQGGLSQFITTRSANGVLVQVVEKSTPSADPTSSAYIELKERLNNYLGAQAAASLLADSASAELAKSAPVAP